MAHWDGYWEARRDRHCLHGLQSSWEMNAVTSRLQYTDPVTGVAFHHYKYSPTERVYESETGRVCVVKWHIGRATGDCKRQVLPCEQLSC